jgi:tRNA threonylcarbamoyladenosine biosynthesis protein TsaB
MNILAVDTSTGSGSIALLQDELLLAEWTLHSARTHNRRLLKVVRVLLEEVGWTLHDIDGFAVTTGPGSFTGLRIGMTTVKTLAWSLNKQYAGVPSLDALAQAFSPTPFPVCPLIDARRGEIYCALYQPDQKGDLIRVTPYRVIPPRQVAEMVTSPTLFCGDGWLAYRDELKSAIGDPALEASMPFHGIRASFVGELARRRFLSGQSEDPARSAPIYIRPSEAEVHYPHAVPGSMAFPERSSDD